jgi:hypothetical protein
VGGEAGMGQVISGDPGRRRLGCLAWVAAALVIFLGILFFLANAMEAQDRGTYCESLDHPVKCSDPLEFYIPGTALIALGCLGIWLGIRLRRAR